MNSKTGYWNHVGILRALHGSLLDVGIFVISEGEILSIFHKDIICGHSLEVPQ